MILIRTITWMLLLPAFAGLLPAQTAYDADRPVEDLLSGVVSVRTRIPGRARSAAILGTRRKGSGVLIDDSGLVLTVDYLILEAEKAWIETRDGTEVPARIIAHDADNGFGLVRGMEPIRGTPLQWGDSSALARRDPVLIVTGNPHEPFAPAMVVSRHTFEGAWEYLLEDGIFTAPAIKEFAGAALVDPDFRLVGIGSLIVRHAVQEPIDLPGNLFIPIDTLKPILKDLIRLGHPAAPPRPWLGVIATVQFGRVMIIGVADEGPADTAGLKPGDIILEVAGRKVDSLARFYRELWRQGRAGVTVPLKVLQRNELVGLTLVTGDRSQHYRTPMAP